MREALKPFPEAPYRNATTLSANHEYVLYFTIEEDASKVLRKYWLDSGTTEILSALSAEAWILPSKDVHEVYVLESTDGRLTFTDIHGNVTEVPIENPAETIIDISNEQEFFFVKTAEDTVDGEQIQRLYLIDLLQGEINQISNEIMLDSYRIPSIVSSSQGYKILVEESIVFPYELSELNSNSSEVFSNRIFITDLKALTTLGNSNFHISFSELFVDNDADSYVQVLDTEPDYVYVASVNPISYFTCIRKVNVTTNAVDSEERIASLVNSAIRLESGTIVFYSWLGESLTFFNLNGQEILHINLNECDTNVDSLELNFLAAYIDEQYVVFHATEYVDDDEKQMRVIYDIGKNAFVIFRSSFIVYDGNCF